MSKDKKSILEEAATDLMQIVEAAKKQAKDNLAKELPEKFDVLLNEELNKISSKKESVNESEKDVAKEPVVEGKKTDKKKESINEEMDMRDFSIEEVETAFDQANGQEEFSVVPNGEKQEFSVDDIAAAIDSVETLNNEKEVAEETQNVNDPYSKFKEMYETMGQYIKEIEDQQMHENYISEFDQQMGGLYGETFRESLGDEKCNELFEMFVARKKGDPFGEKNEKPNIAESVEEEGDPFGDKSHPAPNVANEAETKPFKDDGESLNEEDKDQPFDDKDGDPSDEQGESIAEQKEQGGKQNYKGREDGGPTQAMIKEEDDDKDEDKIEVEIEVGGEDEKEEEREEKPVDEIHGQSYSAGKVRAGTLPNDGQQYRNRPGHERTRAEWGEVSEKYEKRMKSLIEENKKLSKELNEAKTSFGKAEELVENYKTHLEKYRGQLREMAVFNSNLANVNNILVNEELALTTEDKVSVINKFKSINTIDESDKVYGEILTEMKEGKKTISEDVEEKVGDSVGESSKQKIDEAIERTAYENNEHVSKIKKLMKYVDNRK